MARVRIDSGELPSAKGKKGWELHEVLRHWKVIADGHFEYDCQALLQMIDEVDELRLWEYAEDGFFKTRNEFLEKAVLIDFNLTEQSLNQIVSRLRGGERIGLSRKDQAEQAKADVQRADQNQKTGANLLYNVQKVEKAAGNSQAAILRRMARRAPGVLARWEQGEFKSVAAAAKAAGIKVGQSPLQKLRSAWKAASTEERKIFKTEITNNTK